MGPGGDRTRRLRRDPFQAFIQGDKEESQLRTELLESEHHIKDCINDFRHRANLIRLDQDSMSQEVLEQIWQARLVLRGYPGGVPNGPQLQPFAWKRDFKFVRKDIEKSLLEDCKKNPDSFKIFMESLGSRPSLVEEKDVNTVKLLKNIYAKTTGVRPTLVREREKALAGFAEMFKKSPEMSLT